MNAQSRKAATAYGCVALCALARVLRGLAARCCRAGAAGALASAQPPVPAERVTFDEAIERAIEKNPIVAAIAAAGILRAEGC